MSTSTRFYRATHLGAILKQQGRHKAWLASAIDRSPATVTRLLAGKTTDERIAQRISELLGVPIFLAFDVLTGTEYNRANTDEEAA